MQGFDILFIVIGLFGLFVFVGVIIFTISPKLRGKWMARQLKASAEMMKQAKPAIKDMAAGAINIKKEVLEENEDALKDSAEREADIQAIRIKKGAKAATEGIKEGLTGKKSE